MLHENGTNDVVRTLKEHSWRQLQGDRCIFALYDPDNKLVGLAGIHVDDFLISGDPSSTFFLEAEKKLQGSFRWGKWETSEFQFAGCRIRQREDYSIEIDQEEYVNRWVEEMPIDPNRPQQADLLPSEVFSAERSAGNYELESNTDSSTLLGRSEPVAVRDWQGHS